MLSPSKMRSIDFFLNWKSFLVFSCIVFSAKIIFSAYNNFSAEFFEDWKIADNLAHHGVYAWHMKHGSSAYKLPAYPFFLSVFIKTFGDLNAIKVIIIVQHFLYFLLPILIIKIFDCFQLKAAGFLAAYFFIFSPAYFYYSSILEATNLFILLFAVWGYFYSQLWTLRNSFWTVVVFSIVTAIVALTQIVAVPIMVLMILLLVFYKKIPVKYFLTIGGIAMLVYSPWIIRNYFTFDKIVLSKSPAWQNVFLGYTSDCQILPNHFITQDEERKIFEKVASQDEFESEKIYHEEVLKIVEKDKLAPWKKAINNCISLWFVPKRYFNDNGLSVLIGRKLYIICINFLFLVSLIYFFRRNKTLFLFLCVLFIGFTIPYLIGHTSNIRFKLDFEWIETSVIALFIVLKYFTDKKNA